MLRTQKNKNGAVKKQLMYLKVHVSLLKESFSTMKIKNLKSAQKGNT